MEKPQALSVPVDPVRGDQKMEGGWGGWWVIAFQGPESQRRDAGGEGSKRGFLNLENHGFLLEQDSPHPPPPACSVLPHLSTQGRGSGSAGSAVLCRPPVAAELLAGRR